MISSFHKSLFVTAVAVATIQLGSGCSSGRGATPSVISPVTATRLALEKHRGKVVYIDFWASWCAPCLESFPWMNDMATKYDDLVIIAVNVDRERGKANEFLVRQPVRFDVIYDPDGAMARDFKLDGMPSSFLLDRDGTVRSGHVGFRASDAPKIENEIQTLLGEQR